MGAGSMRSSTVVTNSASPADPAIGLSGAPALSPKPAAKRLRTGPRRASSPAGAPGHAPAPSALLLVGPDGLIVGTPAAAPQAGDAVQPVEDDAVALLTTPAVPVRLTGPGGATEDGSEDAAAPGSTPDATAVGAEGRDVADETPGTGSRPDDAARRAAARGDETSPGTVDAGQAAGPDAQPALLTRRARRLAEDECPGAVVPEVARKAGLPERATATAAPTPLAPTARGRSAGRWVRGLSFAVLVVAMALGLGTVISGHDPAGGETATTINREKSRTQTEALLAQARTLRDAAPDTAARALLKQGAEALEIQLAALAGGPSPVSTAPAPAPAPAPSSAAGATAAGFAGALADSANTLLAHSLTADGAMGRVFAAAGTSRLLLASALDRQLGKPTPQSPYLPVTVKPLPDAAPACKATRNPQTGVSADAALITAAQAEQKAVYAYQVAGSRLPGPGFGRAVELTTVHQDRLGLLSAELAGRCLPVVPPAPGFVLNPAFMEAPAGALAKLEGELVLVYGDVAALSAPATDEASMPSAADARAAVAQPSATRPSTLREIAVAALVGSAANAQEWGGAVGALPGIPDASIAVAPAGPASVPAKP